MLVDRTWELDAAMSRQLSCGCQRMAEAMITLMQSAVQHTQHRDNLVLGSSINGNQVYFWAHDTGERIFLEEHPHIFERFAHGSKVHRQAGEAGLDLAIVKVIVKSHGGGVRLRS